MGRKDSPSASMPMEDYRRKIGKQEWKKNKKEMKEIKRQAEVKKTSSGFTDMMLMIVAFVGVVAAIYLGLYVYLKKDESEGT